MDVSIRKAVAALIAVPLLAACQPKDEDEPRGFWSTWTNPATGEYIDLSRGSINNAFLGNVRFSDGVTCSCYMIVGPLITSGTYDIYTCDAGTVGPPARTGYHAQGTFTYNGDNIEFCNGSCATLN